MNTLSEIAKDIWQLEPKVSDTCQIRYTINYKPSQPISTMDFPVEVSVLLEPAKVCLNHDDFTGTGNDDVRRTQTYKKYPWVYIENKNAPGLGVGRKQFLPVCFDASGEIKGYRND
ncbi:MAG: hypothetical protein ABJN34_02950 [Litoreibacter sp.]|uniref:hypothetical protein n=1 Tax=Litoreibacter sp. TaxID=1969459 RepID=UPI003299B7A2